MRTGLLVTGLLVLLGAAAYNLWIIFWGSFINAERQASDTAVYWTTIGVLAALEVAAFWLAYRLARRLRAKSARSLGGLS